MTTDTQHLKDAFRATGLTFLGYTFEAAMAVPMIRVALECKVKAQHKGKPAPVQPALIQGEAMSNAAWVLEKTRCHYGEDAIFCDCCRRLAARIIAGTY